MTPAQALFQWQTPRSLELVTKTLQRTARPRRSLHNSPKARFSNRRQICVTNARQASTASTPLPASRVGGSARFVFRSSALLIAGLVGGFSVVWGWKTWNYLRTGSKIAAADYKRPNDKAIKSVETTPLVQSLRKEGWIEDEPLRRQGQDEKNNERHLINETLLNRGGLVTQYFRHPTDSITVVVFMADYGCESWPDVVHGGVTTCVIDEALDTHLKHFVNPHFAYDRKICMNYRQPVNPHVVYSVVVRNEPAGEEKINGSDKIKAQVWVNQMIRAPHYIERFDERTKNTERIFRMHQKPKSVKNVEGDATLFLVKPSQSFVGISTVVDGQEGIMSWIRSFFPFKGS